MEEILTSAEEEAKRTGNDGDYPKGIVSSAYPDMTFDAADYQRFSKREVCFLFILDVDYPIASECFSFDYVIPCVNQVQDSH